MAAGLLFAFLVVGAGCSDRTPTSTSEGSGDASGVAALRSEVSSAESSGSLQFLITPTALEFGEVPVGTTSPQQIVNITNTGTDPVVMTGAGGAPGAPFSAVQNCQGLTLDPGQSCQMFFAFSPTEAGPATATSVGTWNGQPFSIELHGIGVGPQLLITPTALEFGEVQMGTTSAQQIVNITNAGTAPLVMSGAGGAPGLPFNAVQNCQGLTLAPGESCQMFFTFSPTEAGPATATSSGTWNGQPFAIELHGTGVGPQLLITPTVLEFGEVQVGTTSPQQIVNITNAGAAPVVMSGAGGAPGVPFNAVQNCQGLTLAPGESCQMFFTFSPTGTGPSTATSSGTWNGQPFAIELGGTGIAQGAEPTEQFLITPTALEFGEVQVGTTSPQQIVNITNAGPAPVVMSAAGGAPGAPFNAAQNCQGLTLAPGESCQMFFSFSPTETGPATGISSGTWNGQPFAIELQGTGVEPKLLITPTALQFGEVPVGTTSPQQIVNITNTGTAPVVMSGAGGAPGGPFNAVQNCQGQTLDPGESCQMLFIFSPTETGLATATSSGTWNGQPFSIELHGTGIGPKFLITPIGLEFGEIQVGTTSPQQIVNITNTGTAPVVMSGAGGAPGSPFNAVQNCQGQTLDPGESCEMFFSFGPTDPGLATATSSGTWNGQPFSIALRGTGVVPVLQVEIDIKPGEGPNCLNPESLGRTPIAVLGSEVFDASLIDRETVSIAGVPALTHALEDVNGDGWIDLVVHFSTRDLNGAGLLTDGAELTLGGMLLDGTLFEGSDVIHLAGGPSC
jgi:hypothetical protein